jgi:hypothetical protein
METTKAECNCSAKELGAMFPGVHATDCPEFIEAIQNRRVPRFDEENQAERGTLEALFFESLVDKFLGGLLGPKPELPRFPGADHDLRDLSPVSIPSIFTPFGPLPKLVNGSVLTTLLTAAVDLLDGNVGDSKVVSARNLIKLALNEIKP